MTSLASLARASDAVKIQRRLTLSGHQTWGFAIYRCTYADEEGWTRFKQIASERLRLELEDSDAPGLLQSHSFKYFEEKMKYDGASKERVRKDFVAWCGSDEARAEGDDGEAGRTMLYTAPRYSYCVHVSAESLASVLGGPQPPEEDFEGNGWVALIDAAWGETSERQDAETEEDEGEEAVEGCTMYDVGWMKMGMQSLGVPAYAYLDNPGRWSAAYKRPPEVWTR